MTQAPMTIYSRLVNPEGVLRRLRELAPQLRVTEADGTWAEATVVLGTPSQPLRLTFRHSPEYYEGPGWSQQMAGFRGYLSQFPQTDHRQSALWLTTTYKFAITSLFEPEMLEGDDPRVPLLSEVAQLLDGVFFSPGCLQDPWGKVLYSVDDEIEDPDAQWPAVLGEAQEDDVPDPADDSQPPTPERVIRRALALAAVTARAMLENDPDVKVARDSLPELVQWINKLGLCDELEPDEWQALQSPIGRLDEDLFVASAWRLEGLAILAWALRLYEVPPHDQLVNCEELFAALRLYDVPGAKQLLTKPSLRPAHELEERRKWQLALHWRLRNYRLNPGTMDFVEFGRTCWFGPFDLSRLPLVGNDLALRGERIDRANAEALQLCSSIAIERHIAINWLCWGPERYSEADVST